MAKKMISIPIKCPECGGTGLYRGFGEKNGAAVVCSGCKGTGKGMQHHEYEDFDGKVPVKDVKRVYRINVGWTLFGDATDMGGIPYDDWAAGEDFPPGSEDRTHTCPAAFYMLVDEKKQPHWDQCYWGSFYDCHRHHNKAACWERWDKEFGNV